VNPSTFAILHTLIRKLAHLTEYLVLSLLLYGSLRGNHLSKWHPRTALWCVVVAAAYSLTDEFHQMFVRGRGASLVDCGIDTAGAALGVLTILVRDRLLRHSSNRVATITDRNSAQ